MKIKNRTLYILLSTLPELNSLLVNNVKEDSWLKKQLFISKEELELRYVLGEQDVELIEEIVSRWIENKLSQKQTSFVHMGGSIKDTEMLNLIKLAKSYGMKCEMIIFDESLKRRYFETTIVNKNTIFGKDIISNSISEDNIDVIGDVHGCYDELLLLLKKLGYRYEDEKLLHPEGRKVIWLGDLIDRGPESIKVLELVYKAVTQDGHYCIKGNHEEYLYENAKKYNDGEQVSGSTAMKATLADFCRIVNPSKREKYLEWINNMPAYYIKEYSNGSKFAFVHANIKAFNPMIIIEDECINGVKGNADEVYQENFKKGINEYTLIRGHIKQNKPLKNVYSLEDNQSFNGNLVALKLDRFSKEISIENFYKRVVTQAVNYDYNVVKKMSNLLKEYKEEEKIGLVKLNSNTTNTLFVARYTKDISAKKLWNKNPIHRKAKGLVLDLKGEIVQHPFDRIFNYRENGTGNGLKDSHLVDAVQKMNGFLLNISRHPYENSLLVSTTGSIKDDNEHIKMGKELISKDLNKRLLKLLNTKYKNTTFMFEAIHSKDPHVIKYQTSFLSLIGARDHNYDASPYKERSLDKIAEDLKVHRPNVIEAISFKEAIRRAKESLDEGFIIRDHKTKLPLLKLKSHFYMCHKLSSLMTKDNIKFMFNSTNAFKKHINEVELNPFIDRIVRSYTCFEYESFSFNKRTKIMNTLLDRAA